MQRFSEWLDSIPTLARFKKRKGEKRGRESPNERTTSSPNESIAKKPKTWSQASSAKFVTAMRGKSRRRYLEMENRKPEGRGSWAYATFDPRQDDVTYLRQMRETWKHACTIQSTSSILEEAKTDGASIHSRKGLTLPLNRPLIRTNPWVSPASKDIIIMTKSCEYSSTQLRDKSSKQREGELDGRRRRKDEAILDESMCSSGYGSQDSSPESSIINPHWVNSPFPDNFGDNSAIEDKEGMQNVMIPLDLNGNPISVPQLIFRRHKDSGNEGRPPSFHAPPPPNLPPNLNNNKSCGTLAKLDENMETMRKNSVQLLKARETRKKHLVEKELCLEHVLWLKEQLKLLRRAPNFEMIL